MNCFLRKYVPNIAEDIFILKAFSVYLKLKSDWKSVFLFAKSATAPASYPLPHPRVPQWLTQGARAQWASSYLSLEVL